MPLNNDEYERVTFYFQSEHREKDEDDLYQLLKLLSRKKSLFLIWMVKLVQYEYGIDNISNLSKKDLMKLMERPFPEKAVSMQDLISKFMAQMAASKIDTSSSQLISEVESKTPEPSNNDSINKKAGNTKKHKDIPEHDIVPSHNETQTNNEPIASAQHADSQPDVEIPAASDDDAFNETSDQQLQFLMNGINSIS